MVLHLIVHPFLVQMIQIFLVGVSSVMVFLSTKHRTQNQELHSSHQFINWLVAGISSDLCTVCIIVFLCVCVTPFVTVFYLCRFFNGSSVVFSKWHPFSIKFNISWFCASISSSVYWVSLFTRLSYTLKSTGYMACSHVSTICLQI